MTTNRKESEIPQPDDWDGESDPICPECEGDGMDKWTDYLLPCPLCQGEQML